jgi:hypothetical protein
MLGGPVRAGDRLMRASIGEGVQYSAVIMSEALETADSLLRRGVPVEWAGEGAYVEVLEMNDHGSWQRSVGRRLTDGYGRVLSGQTILRARHGDAVATDHSVVDWVEQAAPVNWCQMRQTIAAAARAEIPRWRTANGAALVESDATQLPILTQYWSVVPGFTAGNAAAAQAQISAADGPDGEWSAAFICFVMHTAGVRPQHGFVASQRHLSYIVGALRNRENSDANRPFWLVDQVELEHEATPHPGDLICFNRCTRRPNHHDPGCGPNQVRTTHTYASLRRQFGNNNKQVFGSSHCALVVGTTVVGGQRRLETIGGNEGNSVLMRTNIPIDADGMIVNPQALHIFGMIKITGC